LESQLHFQHWETLRPALRFAGTCTKDEHCIETCPTNCIHPPKGEPDFATAAQLYVNPACIDCDACIPVCPSTSIFNLEELPAELQEFVQKNALL
jgi:NAD-dependent dihydropyrimidine dehydrogenase PreA subunit